MPLEVIHSIAEMQARVLQWRGERRRIGLVPTMGALHAGHLSLVATARRDCDITVASIFVNPAQFGPQEDFTRYPRTLAEDVAALDRAGCQVAFVPSAEDIYPAGFSTYIEPPQVAARWEGTCRPGHFRGVCTVVLKLFGIVPATHAYFGQKDYQQQLVLRHMVRDLNVPLEIITCPTLRETAGLAMSSRNRYLSPDEAARALCISRALARVEDSWRGGDVAGHLLREQMIATLHHAGIDQIDYATIAHAETLEELDVVELPAVALIACRVGQTRLIDNRLFTSSR